MVVDLDDYLPPNEVADLLGIRYPTLMARIDRGRIKTLRWGRFHLIPKSEVDRVRDENDNHEGVVRTAG